MAASSSKPTLVHFALVFFVLVSLVLGLLYYVAESGRQSAVKSAEEAKAKEAKANADLSTAVDENAQYGKWVFGARGTPATFGAAGAQDQNSVRYIVENNYIGKYGQAVTDKSFDAILAKMDETIRLTRDDLNKKGEELTREHDALLKLEAKYNAMVASEKEARAKAETDVQATTTAKDEAVKQLDKDIAELKTAYTNIETQYQNDKLVFEKEKKALETRVNNLAVLNQKLKDEIDKRDNWSPEVETGYVRYVDSTSRMVYIDLGSADKLPLRMTFAVYKKGAAGVARGKMGIKGSIEVTKIINEHTAEARINSEDIHDPISAGDPIFTPLWTPGQPKRISMIGFIDINGDNISDREQFHQMMARAGAQIDSEVDDQGELTVRVKASDNDFGISEQTKFLVLGKIPELAEASDPQDTARIQKIQGQLRDLQQAAREHGVRIITLTDLLSWMGFRAEQRLFKPGAEQPYTLNSGARSTATDAARGDRVSAGQTSSAYDPKKKNLKPQSTNTLRLLKGSR